MKNLIWTVAVMMGLNLVYSQHHPSSCDDEKLKDSFEEYGNCIGFNKLLLNNSHSDIKKSCGRSLKICSETLLADVAACPGYFNFTKEITNTVDNVKDYVCSNGSSTIKTFIKEGGQNCVKNNENEISSCVQKFMPNPGTNLKQMGTEEAEKVVNCFIEKLKICNKPELTKILEAIEAITNDTFHPNPLIKYNECIGFNHLLSIIFDKNYSENDITKFCGNDLKICSKTLLMALPASPANLDIIDTAEKLTGYLCFDGGSIIKTFLREGGPNCLNDKSMEISLCMGITLETKSTYVTMKHDIEKVVTNCVAKQVKTCNNTELTKISQEFAEFTHFFHRVSHNKTRHNPNAANGITLSSGLVVVTLITLLI